jgi:hypothetical protein
VKRKAHKLLPICPFRVTPYNLGVSTFPLQTVPRLGAVNDSLLSRALSRLKGQLVRTRGGKASKLSRAGSQPNSPFGCDGLDFSIRKDLPTPRFPYDTRQGLFPHDLPVRAMNGPFPTGGIPPLACRPITDALSSVCAFCHAPRRSCATYPRRLSGTPFQ